MAGPDPRIQNRQIALNLMQQPGFASLPQDVQQIVQDAAALKNIAGSQWASVLSSARQSGMIGPDSPWWMGLAAMAASVIGGQAVSALAGGSGAAAAGAAADPTAGLAGSTYVVPGAALGAAGGGVPLAGMGAGVAGTAAKVGTAAAAGSSGLWSKLFNTALQIGVPAVTSLLGTKMQVDANQAAADASAKAAADALAWQKQVFAQRQTDFAPYIGTGSAAQVKLAELMGLPTPTGGYQRTVAAPASTPPASSSPATPPATPPAAPAAPTVTAPASTPPTAGTPDPGMVKMQAPNGQVSMVPAGQVDFYTQRGATVIP